MNEILLKKELEHIGLSDKEAATYLAALELGKASIQEIAKKSGVKRATTYVATDFLMREGLMSSIQEGKKQYFMAENPERLSDFIDRRKAELDERKKGIERLVPELKQLHQVSEDGPVVKYYRGKEGVLAMAMDFFEEKNVKEVWMIYPADKVREVMTEEDRQRIRFSRSKKDIHVNALYTAREPLPESPSSTRVHLQDESSNVKADIAVYGSTIRLASFEGEAIGVTVKNKQLADTLKTLFRLAWPPKDEKN